MKISFKISGVFFILFLTSLISFAQERVVQGRVFTFDSIPLVNANVEVKSTKQVVKTDTLGNFSVLCNSGDVLKVSAKGFNTEKFELESKIKFAIINLKLKPGAKNREYAIGYGHVTDRNKLNAVANLNNSDVDFSQYSNMYDLIRGRFAGVQVVNGEIIIRGVNSINSSSAALIVLDGVTVNSSVLNTIPPVQVKNISIIKDGSAAIYGSRGSNGVVLIDTKRGND
ncbi:MAG TPA: TonB-dependent receptor plug domain-containing protein [Draconibacterium sp.]|nr:TonB-dependent receptor plug domain-containing protein [Draconibacterium sp.]